MQHRIAFVALALVALGSACNPEGNLNPCNVPATVIMHNGTISASERWIPGHHVVSSSVTLGDDVTLTIEGCADVKLAADASINVTGARARLVTTGTQASPVTFDRLEAATAWGRISVRDTARVELAFTRLNGGGGSVANLMQAESLGSVIAARGSAELLPTQVKLNDVQITGATGIAVMMVASRFDASSGNVTISGSGSYPIYTGADTATEIPTGSYENNSNNNILLHTSLFAGDSNDRPIKADARIPNRGVPYRVGMEDSRNGLIRVGDGREDGPAAVLLEIEAGVTLRFTPSDSNSGILVQGHMVGGAWTTQGALRAVGRAGSPITFTSGAASPTAGDWMGLYFKDAIDARTRVDQAVIEYAGGNSSSRGVCASNGSGNIDADSAVIMFLAPMQSPPSQFLTNTTIRSSANGGVYRSWYDVDMDFKATNTFESVAGCEQSGVGRAQGGCSSMGCS